jgi:hypothetical protein
MLSWISKLFKNLHDLICIFDDEFTIFCLATGRVWKARRPGEDASICFIEACFSVRISKSDDLSHGATNAPHVNLAGVIM